MCNTPALPGLILNLYRQEWTDRVMNYIVLSIRCLPEVLWSIIKCGYITLRECSRLHDFSEGKFQVFNPYGSSETPQQLIFHTSQLNSYKRDNLLVDFHASIFLPVNEVIKIPTTTRNETYFPCVVTTQP